MIQGTYGSQPKMTTDLSTAGPVAVPGNEGVAEVVSAGNEAISSSGEKLEKGDWVLMKSPGFGTWRTHAQGPASAFVKISDEDRKGGVTVVQAGTVSVNPCTAWGMLKGYGGAGRNEDYGDTSIAQSRAPQAGEWFIQNGANSGVGRSAIQLAKAWGVHSINIVRARPGDEAATQKLKDELTALGADLILTEEEAAEKSFKSRVKEATSGKRLPLALNCVGGRSALNLAKVLDEGAYHVTYGAMAKQPVTVPAGMLIFSDMRFTGFWVSRWSEVAPEMKRQAVAEVLKLTREKKFANMPVTEVQWTSSTSEETLREAAQGTLEGFRAGKGVFLFDSA
jgi:trans-2-enoyl-CoA reductase